MRQLAQLRLLSMVLCTAFISGCAVHGESIHGSVSGGIPPGNIFIIVKWEGVIPRPAEAADVCLHTSITKTDANGLFEVPGWWSPFSLWNLLPIINRSTSIAVYKPGFESRPGDGFMFRNGGNIRMEWSVRTPEAQLTTLGFFVEDGVSCSHGEDDAEDTQHVMRDYYQALAEGVRQLGIQSAESERISIALKRKLYPQAVAEKPSRIVVVVSPTSAAIQSATPVPAPDPVITPVERKNNPNETR